MKIEDVITDPAARKFMDPRNGRVIATTHDEWITEEIEKRLAQKAEGKTTYRSLDEVMADNGFHAR